MPEFPAAVTFILLALIVFLFSKLRGPDSGSAMGDISPSEDAPVVPAEVQPRQSVEQVIKAEVARVHFLNPESIRLATRLRDLSPDEGSLILLANTLEGFLGVDFKSCSALVYDGFLQPDQQGNSIDTIGAVLEYALKRRPQLFESLLPGDELYGRKADINADTQEFPHAYPCIGHPNRTLALRYGIANIAQGASKERSEIRLRRLKRLSSDEDGVHYVAKLPDFGDREVTVVFDCNGEFIKTFYPQNRDWFKDHKELELILKDNATFDLKELATFHVQAVLGAKLHSR